MLPSDNPRMGLRRSAMGVEIGPQIPQPPAAQGVAQWPGQRGLAANGDVEAGREYAMMAAQEMRAMGLRALLCPQADLPTEPGLTSDMDVLDFGCGTGLLTLALQPHVHSVTGADSSAGMLGVLEQKVRVLGLVVSRQVVDFRRRPS